MSPFAICLGWVARAGLPDRRGAWRRSEPRRARIFRSPLGSARRLALPLLLAFNSLSAADTLAPSHLDHRAAAAAAYQRRDYAAAKTATLAALEIRPDSPRYLYNLAALAALTGDAAGAIGYLQRLAGLGVSLPVERDPDFASLQGTPPFLRVLQQLAAHRAPQGEVDTFADLPGRTGIIEGLAFRPRTGDLFFSDVHHRCLWRRDRAGQISRFSAEDEDLLGMFGIAIDEERNALWVAMTAVPEMAGFNSDWKGEAALAEFNLATSELRRVIPVPGDGRDHGLGDLVIGPDGTIFATDSKAPVIWKLAPDADDFEKVVDSPVFASLQGITRWKGELIVADYSHGLFAVEITSGRIRAFAPPAGSTLLGLDGLVATAGGLVATQNGVEPQRIVRIALTPEMESITGVTVLAAALPQLGDLSLITIVDGRPTFIAGAGWEGFDPQKTRQPPAHTVRILQVSLP